MAQIIWIASYPKSGNTWVRNLVANVIFGEIANSAALMELIPDIHVAINASHLRREGATFIKTHWMYHPKLPLREDTAAAIYVVRHPLDVIVSNLNYYLLRHGEAYFGAPEAEQARIRQAYVDSFIEHGGEEAWLAHGFGGWAEHVASWLHKDVPFPRLTVRYEDLEADPADFVAKLCKACNVERSAEAIAAAIKAASFERMQEMEEREIEAGTPGFFNDGSFGASHAQGLRFMNTGRSGSYRQHLTPEQQAKAAERFAGIMQPLGYDT